VELMEPWHDVGVLSCLLLGLAMPRFIQLYGSNAAANLYRSGTTSKTVTIYMA